MHRSLSLSMAPASVVSSLVQVLLVEVVLAGMATPATAQCAGTQANLCGAGPLFCKVSQQAYSDAVDIFDDASSTSGACRNYIQCGGGLEEIYQLNVDTKRGTLDPRNGPNKYVYYGKATLVAKGFGSHPRAGAVYTWERFYANGDGCACLCAVVKHGLFTSRSECQCKF